MSFEIDGTCPFKINIK